MSTWDKRYTDRVQLLVDILPMLSLEPRFALKGGTAINLFEHDLPRLSVDIDLTWLPTHGFAEDAAAIYSSWGYLVRWSPSQDTYRALAFNDKGEGVGNHET